MRCSSIRVNREEQMAGVQETEPNSSPPAGWHPDPASARREELVTDRERFAELRDQWNELSGGNLFLTWEWLDCWWQSFGGGAQMRVHLSWDGPELAAGMACGLQGRHLFAMAGVDSDFYLPVARSARDLGPALEQVVTGPWSRITIRALPADDPITERLGDLLRSNGWLVVQISEPCPILHTSGSFEDYYMGLSTKTRSNDRRARRRLAGEGKVELRVIEPVEEVEQVFGESFALEATSWKGRSNQAILSSKREEGFWRELYDRFHRLGGVRFSELRLDGTLIAFSLDVLHNRRLYGLKTGYDERYAFFSPGNVLLVSMIERAFEGETEAIEMLSPTSPRKERYATDAREKALLRSYRRGPGYLVRYGGRRWLAPRLRPMYFASRRALGRVRERPPPRPRSAGARPERGPGPAN